MILALYKLVCMYVCTSVRKMKSSADEIANVNFYAYHITGNNG